MFKRVEPEQPLQNPDEVRERLVYDITMCLLACEDADEVDVRGKHSHGYMAPDFSRVENELQMNVYWTRSAVGIKRRVDGGLKHCLYLSRPTMCVGTNIVLAKYWVNLPELHVFFFAYVVGKPACADAYTFLHTAASIWFPGHL